MATGSLLMLLDDIATILDDVALMTKVAAKKTAGVLGDDLALNAQQVVGVNADRELPVVWAVAKGSFLNKLILVPLALLISAFVPSLVTPLLMIGGLYLCYEGVEKLVHSSSEHTEEHQEHVQALVNPHVDMVAFEREKVSGAIRTDFILSAEIIVIALGTVSTQPLLNQVLVLAIVAVAMTIGVYGLVAGIVRLDDMGFYLNKRQNSLIRLFGQFLINLAPYLMKSLSIIGTAAMFMVGGSILAHGIPAFETMLVAPLEHTLATVPVLGEVLATLTPLLMDTILGIVLGAIALGVMLLFGKLKGLFTHQTQGH